MSKYVHYLLLLLVLIVPTGCETVKGAASGTANGASAGLDRDVHNASDPDKNGWNVLKKADAWLQEHLW